MIVVGTRKINSNAAPIFWFFPSTRSTGPTTRQTIAATKNNAARGSGIPRPTITQATEVNLVIFKGTTITKTADKQILPIRSTDL